MTCAIMQPTYLPWLGYFELINRADVFVIYDCVQFEKQSWQQRNRIRDRQGEIMLSVPIRKPSGLKSNILDIEIDCKQKPNQKHLKSIELAYGRSKNFSKVYSDLELIYASNHEKLIDLNFALIKYASQHFQIEDKFHFASKLGIQLSSKVESLISICKHFGADTYYSPIGSKGYIDENNLFPTNGIELVYQAYTPPVYQQLNYPNHISHLAFIDYLFNCDEPLFRRN